MEHNSYPGDFVTANGRAGRVYNAHPYCPENDRWLKGQTLLGDDPRQYKLGRWVSILVHGGGSIVVPDLPGFVQKIESFDFSNPYASDYFREDESE